MLMQILALALQAAAASPPTDDPQSEIVVQGTRISREQIRDFVKAVTDVPYAGQVGRFHAAVCPVAMGLSPAQDAAIAERMRRVAAAAKMRVARPPCTPNVFVIVAPEKKWAIEELARRFPAYFATMPTGEEHKLASTPGPAVAWQVDSRLSADGQTLEKPGGGGYYVLEGTQNPSRIKRATMPTFVASVVVIDIKAAAGLTVTQLADYAAMRTFAATDPNRVSKSGAPTILGVLGQPEDKPLPATMTYWDLGYLASLYSTDNAYYANYQRGDMERAMREELERSGAAQRKQ